MTPTVTVQYMRILIDYCENHGLAAPVLLRHAKLATDLLSNAEERIAFADFMSLCNSAESLLQDPDLALKVGQEVTAGYYGIHGYSILSAATSGEGLHRSLRYHAMVHTGGRNEFVIEDGMAIMSYHSNMQDMPDLGRFQNELCLSAWVQFARWGSGLTAYSPTYVEFMHAEPADTFRHQQVFNCPLYFSAARNAIAFPAILLELPSPQANPTVLRIMDELSERYLLALGHSNQPEWLNRAQRYIAEYLQNGLPTIEQVAIGIGMSARELQLQLKKNKLLFSKLLDSTRSRLAKSYVCDPTLSLLDISYLLGFSEQSAFTRAFKRWLGKSPGIYRQEITRQKLQERA